VRLILAGAVGSSMSGSGSAVFGIFDEIELAMAASSFFEKQYSQVYLLEL
jgi:4-diphosphocytidyl-2-C-methyl-D-erythritol kinase